MNDRNNRAARNTAAGTAAAHDQLAVGVLPDGDAPC
jgi:hypothetical protein